MTLIQLLLARNTIDKGRLQRNILVNLSRNPLLGMHQQKGFQWLQKEAKDKKDQKGGILKFYLK